MHQARRYTKFFLLLFVFVYYWSGVLAAPQFNTFFPEPTLPTDGQDSILGTLPVIPPYYTKVRVAHAALASAAWLVFFPVGAILIRTVETGSDYNDVQIHAIVQMVGYFTFVAAAGMGIWMAKTANVLNQYHPIIGMTLLACISIQPMTEILNAQFYSKYPKMIILAHLHIWVGRLLITVGIIQGGLGFVFSASLPLASTPAAPRIVYGVIAIVVWILYVSLAIVWPEVKQTFGWWRRRHKRSREDGEMLRTRSLDDGDAPSAINMSNGNRR